MADKTGIWIDHRRTVIVFVNPDGERTAFVNSNVEKHGERGGDSPLKGPYEAAQVPSDDRRQRALTGELDAYYDAVIAAIGASQAVLLFGPGEAKGELHKRLEKKHLGGRVVAVETADKMTDHEIVAKVRTYFGFAAPRVQ